MNITYQEATEEDAYGINYVIAHSWKETYTGLLPDEYLNKRIENIPNKTEQTKEFIRNYKGKYIVAKDGEKVIGILAYCPSENEEYKDYGYLNAIYLLKEYQGLGIGKELFQKAIQGLQEMGYDKMYLECMTGNQAIDFYKKYDGIIVGQTDYPINSVGEVKADVVLFHDLNKMKIKR